MFSPDLLDRATAFLDAARARAWRVATAESCTGGLVTGLLTEIAGSSAVVDRGFVTYSNEAKTALLGVGEALLASHGAVSAACAAAMAEGALRRSAADLSVAITGIAGPGGELADKPVGLVHLALASRGGRTDSLECRFGDRGRAAIRLASVAAALDLLERAVRDPG